MTYSDVVLQCTDVNRHNINNITVRHSTYKVEVEYLHLQYADKCIVIKTTENAPVALLPHCQ